MLEESDLKSTALFAYVTRQRVFRLNVNSWGKEIKEKR